MSGDVSLIRGHRIFIFEKQAYHKVAPSAYCNRLDPARFCWGCFTGLLISCVSIVNSPGWFLLHLAPEGQHPIIASGYPFGASHIPAI